MPKWFVTPLYGASLGPVIGQGVFAGDEVSKRTEMPDGYRYAETGLPYTQDSGTLAYLLELSPIFASCHHRFCIEDFPSPNPSRFKS